MQWIAALPHVVLGRSSLIKALCFPGPIALYAAIPIAWVRITRYEPGAVVERLFDAGLLVPLRPVASGDPACLIGCCRRFCDGNASGGKKISALVLYCSVIRVDKVLFSFWVSLF